MNNQYPLFEAYDLDSRKPVFTADVEAVHSSQGGGSGEKDGVKHIVGTKKQKGVDTSML